MMEKVIVAVMKTGLTQLVRVKLNPVTQLRQVVVESMQVAQGEVQARQLTA